MHVAATCPVPPSRLVWPSLLVRRSTAASHGFPRHGAGHPPGGPKHRGETRKIHQSELSRQTYINVVADRDPQESILRTRQLSRRHASALCVLFRALVLNAQPKIACCGLMVALSHFRSEHWRKSAPIVVLGRTNEDGPWSDYVRLSFQTTTKVGALRWRRHQAQFHTKTVKN